MDRALGSPEVSLLITAAVGLSLIAVAIGVVAGVLNGYNNLSPTGRMKTDFGRHDLMPGSPIQRTIKNIASLLGGK